MRFKVTQKHRRGDTRRRRFIRIGPVLWYLIVAALSVAATLLTILTTKK